MPAKSKKQRRLMAIAEHHPELLDNNSSVLKMSKGQLHDFATTKEKGLPLKAPKSKEKKESVDQFIKRRNAKEEKR